MTSTQPETEPGGKPSESEFWRYFVETGVFDEELCRMCFENSDSTLQPLGRWLVNMGAIDLDQVLELLTMQKEDPSARIGDLAVRSGMCSEEDVDRALADRQRGSRFPVELMLFDDPTGDEPFFGAMIRYVRFLQGRRHSLVHDSSRVSTMN